MCLLVTYFGQVENLNHLSVTQLLNSAMLKTLIELTRTSRLLDMATFPAGVC